MQLFRFKEYPHGIYIYHQKIQRGRSKPNGLSQPRPQFGLPQYHRD